jgi:hypothetical protein
MTEQKQSKKRVVSKSKYGLYLMGKTWLGYVSIVLSIVGSLFILFTVWCAMIAYVNYGTVQFASAIVDLLVCGFVSAMLVAGATAASRVVGKIEPVLPETRQNIQQLPTEETLLRASQEPTEGQEKVLLRAAITTTETPPEQLLRPTDATNA